MKTKNMPFLWLVYVAVKHYVTVAISKWEQLSCSSTQVNGTALTAFLHAQAHRG